MLINLSPCRNRWCRVHPAAKTLFSIMTMIAAFVSSSAATSLLLTLITVAATVAGAGVPLLHLLRLAAPGLIFLTAGTIPMLITVNTVTASGLIPLEFALTETGPAAVIYSRSTACLSALLFLALTTPLADIISLSRRCRLPEIILDIMTLCYRTIFVLSRSIEETMTAQSARLGYATAARSFRSLGGLVANLAVDVWHRSRMLHQAAEARNCEGTIRFLEQRFERAGRHIFLSATTGGFLIILAMWLP